MKEKRCFWFSIAGMLGVFITISAINIVIDPFFHYHAPLKCLQYPINDEIYMNNGILRHFEYDSVITGTSMAQNFKTSTFNSLFSANAVKTTLSGENYRRIGMNLQNAFSTNRSPKYVLWVLDWSRLRENQDRHDSYPEYLYDSSLLNDWKYVLNKDISRESLNVVLYTIKGNKTTSFDVYSNWNSSYQFGKEAILSIYSRQKKQSNKGQLTSEEISVIKDNLDQNVINIIEKSPETVFFIIFPPYSIYYWDDINQTGLMDSELEAQKTAIEQLLPFNNVKLFSFNNNFKLICNENNYKDFTHYGEEVNDQILHWIRNGEYQITQENAEAYIETTETFYRNYPYDSLFDETPANLLQ